MTEQITDDVLADLRAAQTATSVANPNRTRLMDLLSWDDAPQGI